MAVNQKSLHKNNLILGHNFLKTFLNFLAVTRRSYTTYLSLSKFISSVGGDRINTSSSRLNTSILGLNVQEIMSSEPKPQIKKEKKGKIAKREKKIKITKKAKTAALLLMLRCPICLENLNTKKAVSTKCGHVFCRKCLQRALHLSSNCPTCRQRLTGNRYHTLYLTNNYDDGIAKPEEPMKNPDEDSAVS